MVLSLTFVPAAVATVHYWQGLRKEKSNHERRRMALQTSACKPRLRFRWYGRVIRTIYVGGAGWLASTMGSEFIPQLDEGDVTVQALRPPGTSLQQSIEMQDILERRLLDFPKCRMCFQGSVRQKLHPILCRPAFQILLLFSKTEANGQIHSGKNDLLGRMGRNSARNFPDKSMKSPNRYRCALMN